MSFKKLKSINNQKGQALVEFAIVLPILIMLVMGILQFGMMLNAYLTIENASREGARAGIVGSTDSQIQTLIIADSPTLDPQSLTVTITPQQASRQSGGTLSVRVTYKYKLTVPIISNIFNNAVVLNGQTSMRIE
jgi:Flp pilus assembly protein TadG